MSTTDDRCRASIRAALLGVLAQPDARRLWRLRADLLESGLARDTDIWSLLDEYSEFLDRVATSTTSREYSEFASKLDVGAVGGVALEQVLEAEGGQDLARRVLMALVTEGLMVTATRQHVKAWKGELDSVYRRAAWSLYERLWRWAESQKAELPAGERRRLCDRIFAPIHEPETNERSKTILIGRLFQLLLASQLARVLR